MKVTNKPERVPPRASAEPTTANSTSVSPTGELLSRTLDMLAAVVDRAAELRKALQNKPPDHTGMVALFSVALAASANLSAENIASLTEAIRRGRLPRRRATA